MKGETDLGRLLASMSPELIDEEFVFLTFNDAVYGDFADLKPMFSVVEQEGLTLVVPKANADLIMANYDSIFRCITLQIHSSLDAVGLTAAFAQQLTKYGISANVIAGYFHDHIFVHIEDADRAVAALKQLSGA